MSQEHSTREGKGTPSGSGERTGSQKIATSNFKNISPFQEVELFEGVIDFLNIVSLFKEYAIMTYLHSGKKLWQMIRENTAVAAQKQ